MVSIDLPYQTYPIDGVGLVGFERQIVHGAPWWAAGVKAGTRELDPSTR
jgi:hypothetical protein